MKMDAKEIMAIIEKFLDTLKRLIEAIFGGNLADVIADLTGKIKA